MHAALRHSGVPASSVRYINAHATSTPIGDEIEQEAVLKVFGEELAQHMAVSSTKGATGHLLGAAGALEAAVTILALHHGVAPPTCNLHQPDPHLLPGLVMHGAGVPLPGEGPRAAMCNSFGFGGTNASVLFTSPPAA
jgi:3-oxoacyl-[acyl-carrier-protein] synthase II